MSKVKDIAKKVKADSFKMNSLSEKQRNDALESIANALNSNRDKIQKANQEDLRNGEKERLASPIMKRLKFDDSKIDEVIKGIEDLIGLDDPLNKVLLKRELDKDLVLNKITCPIGVIGVIFESRPDALVQIASLCLKSGDCAILKGGSEAANTNVALYEIIAEAIKINGIPDGFITLLQTRSDIDELLGCHGYIDLLIPRGSNEFVKYIMDNSDIPVMGHSDGICHVYVDKAADVMKSVPIIRDSKVQYVAACNATETLLVHRDIAKELLPALEKELVAHDVQIKGDSETGKLIDCEIAEDEDFQTEYLDYILSIKIVDDMDEAIEHINKYGSHHTDCILSEDDEAVEKFMVMVDSSGVYRNCSTRFADGFRYGFGAEVGISTGKLHARGPVGLDGLVTYKYKLYGDGQIVADYAEGRKEFKFNDLI